MNSVSDVLREELYQPTLRAMSGQIPEQARSKSIDSPMNPPLSVGPAANIQVRTAKEYDAQANALVSNVSGRALSLAQSAKAVLDQLIAKVEQMKEVASKGALTKSSDIDRVFLRMDLSDLYKEYNAIAISAYGELTNGLSGDIARPVEIERVGERVSGQGFTAQGYTFFDLSKLSRPISKGDQVRLRIGANPEFVYTANRDLYPRLPTRDDPQWAMASSLAESNVIQALQSPDNGMTSESSDFNGVQNLADVNGRLLDSSSPQQFGDGRLLFFPREYSQYLTVRAFLSGSSSGSESPPGSAKIGAVSGNPPLFLRSLADTRIRGLEVDQGAIANFTFLNQGGAGYLGGADASNIPVNLLGGTGEGALGFGDISRGSFLSIAVPYRGLGYTLGDELTVSLRDVLNRGAGFSAIIEVGQTGEITSLQPTSRGSDYLGGGSGVRVPVKIVQTQNTIDPDFNIVTTEVSSARGNATINAGEVTHVTLSFGGTGYQSLDPLYQNQLPNPVELRIDAGDGSLTESKLRISEVGTGNSSPDALIYDALYRSLDQVVGRVYFGSSGRSAASAPTPDQFSAVLTGLEALTPVLKRQSIAAKLETDRLETEIRARDASSSESRMQSSGQNQVSQTDGRYIKLTRLLSRSNIIEYTTITLIDAARLQVSATKLDSKM